VESSAIHNYFEQIKTTRTELVGMMSEIRHMLRTGQRDGERIAELLGSLCDDIAHHFDQEEEGGYLGDVLHHAPEFHPQATQLYSQHSQLRREVAELRRFAAAGDGSEEWWDALFERFETFAEGLLTHEAHEGDLVREALHKAGG